MNFHTFACSIACYFAAATVVAINTITIATCMGFIPNSGKHFNGLKKVRSQVELKNSALAVVISIDSK